MKRLLALAAVVVAAAAARADGPHPHAAALKKQAAAWLAENNKFGPTHRIVDDLGGAVAKAVDGGRNFSLTIGPDLTRSGSAYVVASWGDRVFAFELTDAQRKATGVDDAGVSFTEGSVARETGRPAYKLGGLAFAGGPRVDGGKPLAGTVACERTGKPVEKLAVRVSYSAGGSTVSRFRHLDAAPADGKLSFDLKPLSDGDAKVAGPVVVFCDLCVVRETATGVEVQVASNPTAVLLDVK